MTIKQSIEYTKVPVHIWTDDVDQGARAQLANVASLSFVHSYVAVMADVHVGKGATESFLTRHPMRQEQPIVGASARDNCF